MQKLADAEIAAAEKRIGARLPPLYRKLLTEIGHGREGSVDIYHPGEIRALYESFFDDPGQLFAVYFPFGCNNGRQELWVIDIRADRAAAIWHEIVPDDWPEETWLGGEDWMARHLRP